MNLALGLALSSLLPKSSGSGDPLWASVVASLPLTSDKTDLKGNTTTLVGNAVISGGFLNLDGNGDSLDLSAAAAYAQAGDFTLEGLFTFSGAPSNSYLWDTGSGNQSRVQLGTAVGGFRNFGQSAEIASGAFAPSAGVEYYIAVVRSGSTVTAVRGPATEGSSTVTIGSGSSTQQYFANAVLRIGNYGGGGAYGIAGTVRHIRLTAAARTVSTVPAFPYPTQ